MGWVAGWARVLAGCGVAGCLALPGELPATAAAGAAAAGTAAVRPVGLGSYPELQGQLYSVAAVSASDVWAVGTGDTGALIMHWNGIRWSSFIPSGGLIFLNGVAARSAADVWAVGETGGVRAQTVAMHWNGRSWTRVRTPALNSNGSAVLNAVAVISAGNAWAVGYVIMPDLTDRTLIEHWNGRQWTVQRLAALPGGGGFNGVTARSADDVWAVGFAGAQTLIEHWNGTRWARVASPDVPGASRSTFSAVTAIGADDAWAVGYAFMPDGTEVTLTAFWNGRIWQRIDSINPGFGDYLLGVTASWTHNIWAVGNTNPINPAVCSGDGCGATQTLIMHWNSTRWKMLPSPNPNSAEINVLTGIAAVTRDDIWAVGWGNVGTIIVHWNGHTWS